MGDEAGVGRDRMLAIASVLIARAGRTPGRCNHALMATGALSVDGVAAMLLAMLAKETEGRLAGEAFPLCAGVLADELEGLHEMITPSDSLSESMVML